MHPTVCRKVFVSLCHMHPKGTAIEVQFTLSVKMLYTSYPKRGQSTCFAVEEKMFLDYSSFHRLSVGSDSYQKACKQVKQESLNSVTSLCRLLL